MRVTVRVTARAHRCQVGGSHDGALLVRVPEPAVDGRATAAACRALAQALGVPAREVVLVSGAASRTKVLEVPDAVADLVAALLDR